MKQRGRVHIYCGDGKGKTTAAFGLALRWAGRGGGALIVQLLKGADSGEVTAAERVPGIRVIRACPLTKFTNQMDEAELAEVRRSHMACLDEARLLLETGNYGLLVIDELMGAWSTGLVDREGVLDLIDNRPPAVELVLTGRDPDQSLLDRADYVTEMKKGKHPFDQGVPARLGIEY